MVAADNVVARGKPKVYASSAQGRRSFCGACGAGPFFSHAPLQRMGMMQPPMGERIGWIDSVHALPAFERFPVSG